MAQPRERKGKTYNELKLTIVPLCLLPVSCLTWL